MNKDQSELIAVSELRVGMFVELGIGWMSHPFPTGSFRISSGRQIETIRALGLAQVRYFPDSGEAAVTPALPGAADGGAAQVEAVALDAHAQARRAPAAGMVKPVSSSRTEEQQRQLQCERRFQEAAALYRIALDQVQAQPQKVKAQCEAMVGGLLNELAASDEMTIRLLSSAGAGRSAAHATNVMVLSLLLGKAMGLPPTELAQLGAAAFLHDIGKTLLPERVHAFDDYFSVAEYRLYQDHVLRSVEIGRSLALSSEILTAIAQHHELIDGSGFPRKSRGDEIGRLGRILALVNRYDNLCNPAQPSAALTPHEALSTIYTQMKGRFDAGAVNAFIRMLGVYPPGTVIQLTDERYAMVVASNVSRSLKPRVLIHEPLVPRHEAAPVELELQPDLGIRRGIKPIHLPLESADYLAPRQRVCYFFEPAQQHEALAA